jgi:hypothetical protein
VTAPSDPLLVATLAALAGVRRGDRVVVVGGGPRLTAALLAMAGAAECAEDAARVAAAGRPGDVGPAVRRMAPGGRLVAVAADDRAARRCAAQHGLALRHVEPVGDVVAWSAVHAGDAQAGA